MVFFMTTNKKQQCYPLCFLSWRPIKNNSVTPYVSFDKNDSVTPHVSFDKNDSVTPCVFFNDDQRKTTVSPPMFYLINIDSVFPLYFYFMTADKKRQSYPSCFFHVDQWRLTVAPLSTYLQGSEHELFRVLTSEHINAPSRHRNHNGYTWLYNSHAIEIRVYQQMKSTGLEPRSPGG